MVRSPLAMLNVGAEPVVDPSKDEMLCSLGSGYVTTLIEDLSKVRLVSSPAPLMSERGMWIGYRLTALGRDQARAPTMFESAVRLPGGLVAPEVAASLQEVLREAESTMASGAWCGSIMLYGRFVETLCLGVALDRGVIKDGERLGLDAILNRLKRSGFLADDDVVRQSMTLLKSYRNTAVHPGWTVAREELERAIVTIRLPTRDDAETMQRLVRNVITRFDTAPR